MGREREEAAVDGLFVGAPIFVSEAGSPYDGLAGTVKKLSGRTIHVKLDDSAAFGDVPRILRRAAARLRSEQAPATDPYDALLGGADVLSVVSPEDASGVSKAVPAPAVMHGMAMYVSCTATAKTGQLMHVILPDGAQHEVVVPCNVEAGDGFEVAAPVSTSPQPFEPSSPVEEPEDRHSDQTDLVVGTAVVVLDTTSPNYGCEGMIARIGEGGQGIATVVFSGADDNPTQRLLRASTLRALDSEEDASSFLATWPPPSRTARKSSQLAAGVRARSNSSDDRLSPILTRLRAASFDSVTSTVSEVHIATESGSEPGFQLELELQPEPEPEPEPEPLGPTEEDLEKMREEVERVETRMRSAGRLSRCVVGLSPEQASPDAVELTVLVAPNDFLPIQETLLVARVEDLHSLLQLIVEALDLAHYYKQDDLALSLYVQDVSKAMPLFNLSEVPTKAKLHLWSVRKFWEQGFSEPSPKPSASRNPAVFTSPRPKVPPISHENVDESNAMRVAGSIGATDDGLQSEMDIFEDSGRPTVEQADKNKDANVLPALETKFVSGLKSEPKPEPEPEPELQLETRASSARATFQQQSVVAPSSEVSMMQAVVRDDATAIHNIISIGHWDVEAEMAVDAGDIGSEGQTLLMLAATRGSTNVARLLLDHGAVPDSRDKFGCTALMHAAKNGHSSAITVLLECNADVELHSSFGTNALHCAAETGHSVAIQCLVNGKADINAKDANDRSALEITVTRGHRRALEALIRSGALNAAQVDGLDRRETVVQNAIDRAEAYGHRDILAILTDESRRGSRMEPNQALSPVLSEAETPVSSRPHAAPEPGRITPEDSPRARGPTEETDVASASDATIDVSGNSVELQAVVQAALKDVAAEIAEPIVKMVQAQEESIRQSVAQPLLEQLRIQNEHIAILQGQLNEIMTKTRHLDSSRSPPVAFTPGLVSPIPSVESRDDNTDLTDSLVDFNSGNAAAALDAPIVSQSTARSGALAKSEPAVPDSDEMPNAILDRIQQSRQRSSSFLEQVQRQNKKMSGLVQTVAVDTADQEPSSPTDLPDGGVDTSRSKLRLVPSSSSVAASEEAKLEKELIDQIRAEAENVSFEEVERQVVEAVRMTQAAENTVKQRAHLDAPKSPPHLRGPSLSPLEVTMKSLPLGDDAEPGSLSPKTPPSPSAIPRHQRLYGYERRLDATSSKTQTTPKRTQLRLSDTTTTVPQASATSIPTARSGNRPGVLGQASKVRSQGVPTFARPELQPKLQQKQKPSPSAPSSAVVASNRFSGEGLARKQTNSHGSGTDASKMGFKKVATAVVASNRFSNRKLAQKRTNSGGSGRGEGNSSAANIQMKKEVWILQQAQAREIREKILIIYLNNQVSLDVDTVMRKWTAKHGAGTEEELLRKVEQRYGKTKEPQPEPDPDSESEAELKADSEPQPERDPELHAERDLERRYSTSLSDTPRTVMLPSEEPEPGEDAETGGDGTANEEHGSTAGLELTAMAASATTAAPERSIFDEDDDDWLEAGGFDSPSPPPSPPPSPASPARENLHDQTSHSAPPSTTSSTNAASDPKPKPATGSGGAGRGRQSGTVSFADFQRAKKALPKVVSARDRELVGGSGRNPGARGTRTSPAGRHRG